MLILNSHRDFAHSWSSTKCSRWNSFHLPMLFLTGARLMLAPTISQNCKSDSTKTLWARKATIPTRGRLRMWLLFCYHLTWSKFTNTYILRRTAANRVFKIPTLHSSKLRCIESLVALRESLMEGVTIHHIGDQPCCWNGSLDIDRRI